MHSGSSLPGTRRERWGKAAIFAGLTAALPSVWQTVTHVTDETYRAPEVRHGEGHVQYHMAREALITAGALGAVVVATTAGARRGRALWRCLALSTTGFTAAMWSGGPVTGVWAPNRKALLIHVGSTTGLALGTWLLRPRKENS
ncbi:hypothetical protein [Amycolatopsis sp. NPDC059021]|uniref:hypothetical protein n=1 Tax=Amycolatopsis sp. NPDC059021 TaxID=3346704 RepID=UPI00366B84FB